MAERDPVAIHLANERSASADLCDKRCFAETHLPHSLTEISVTGQFTNATHRTSGKLAEREQ
jgi:hypothetical protein